MFGTKRLLIVLFISLFVCSFVQGQVKDEYEEYDDDDVAFAPKAAEKAADMPNVPLSSDEPKTESSTDSIASPKPINFNSILDVVLQQDPSEYLVQLGLILLCFIYYGNYLYGSRVNENLAKVWLKSSIEYYSTQFARLGDERGFFLIRNGADDYIFYASGRSGCKFMFGHVYLFPRHDIFAMLYSLYQPTYDHVEVNFELNDNAPKCVFGIVPRKSANALRKERFDVNAFTKQNSEPSLPENLVVLSEHGDISRSVLSSQIGEKLREVKTSFEGFVVSDQPRLRPEAIPPEAHNVLTLKYRLQSNLYPALHRLSLFLVDVISTLEIRSDIRSKLSRNRDDAYAELQKEELERKKEEVEQRLQEKRRLELEERSQLSRTAQRKLEEKEAKKASRKKAAKMTMKVK